MIALSAQSLHCVITTKRTETSILHGCDLELQGGGLAAVVGHFGSGESSLLACLSSLDEPTSDTVTINGRDVYQQSAAKRAKMLRSEVGSVSQQCSLVLSLAVEENITLSFLLDHKPASHDLVRGLIESFGLNRCSCIPVHSLSGDEQQRTVFCQALVRHPGIVFADEPTGALDSQNMQIILGTLRRMADEGQMIIMVTHDLDAAVMADRIVIMHDGRTVRHLGRCISRELLQFMADLKARNHAAIRDQNAR